MRLALIRKRTTAWLAAMLVINLSLYFFDGPSRAQIISQPNPNAAAPQPGKYQKAIEMLDGFIRREIADKDLPALSIALVDGQNIVWQQGYGFADPQAKTPVISDTIFRVGSVSKLFTDIAVMRLVERGKIDLDAPVDRYLPDFKPRNTFGKLVTLRQLMSHRSGLVREPPVGNYFDSSVPTLAETVKSLNRTAIVYEPETRTKYSNAAIATVGLVVEKTQNQPFAQYLKHTLLDPLGMRSSDFEPTPANTKNLAKAQMWTVFGTKFDAPNFELGMAPAGSMYATTGDLCKFISALLSARAGEPGAILKRETLEQMWAPQFAKAGQKNGIGLGFFVSDFEGRRKVEHGGAIYGFSTELSLLPDDKLGVVVAASKDFSNGVISRVADAALKAMLAVRNNDPVPQPEKTVPIDKDLARKIAGRYAGGDKVFDLIERAGSLSIFDLRGGFETGLRSIGDSLITDSPFAFGTRITPSADGILINNETFKRSPVGKPSPVPDKWRGLVGEYGPDYDILYIFERDGKLWALIEQFEFDPIEEVSENVFNFPKRGLYDGEQLVFKRDTKGRAVEVVAANVTFKRRQVGPEDGAQQLLIKPMRPVSELLREALNAQPPKESGDFLKSDLVEITKLDKSIKLDIRYASTNNFLGSVFYPAPRAFLQRPAAEALARVNRKLLEQGYGLLVHDGYRPWYVTKVFWDATPADKKIFVADPSKGSRHNRGAAVDLTLYDIKTGNPVDMPGTYDETTDRSYPDYPGGTSLQRWHRELLRDAMESEGFTVYEAEWWHFDYNDWRRYPIGNKRFDDIEKK
jgi:CubicO group peptidase (beta-lactamase class C family)/D-alanyl-D-alanine dipeptidase